MRGLFVGAVCLLLGLQAGAQETAALPLKVCMAENNAPFSARQRGAGMSGFDVELTRALAASLGRRLEIIPFESKFENESTLTQEVNALLSSGVCELASGFPLMAEDLGPPSRPVARVPDHPGARQPPRLRPWITLQPLAASDAYQAVAMTLVVKKPAYAQLSLAEPQDARLGAITGTLGGAALMLYRGGRLRPQIVSLSRTDDLLQAVADERIDAALVAQDRLDLWKQQHPDSALHSTGYVHPLRLNLGYVALASSTALLAQTSAFLRAAGREGRLAQWAQRAGLTYLAPRPPFVAPGPRLQDLMLN